MTTLSLFDGSISDATTAITLIVRRDLDNAECPIAVTIDGAALLLTLDQAAKLAKAGERIEKTLFKSKEAPKESVAVFAHKIGFPSGEISVFELAIEADPLGVAFTWASKRLALGLGSIADLLFALSQVGKAVGHIRGVPEPAFDDARGVSQRPFQPPSSPAPGTRWQSWTPRCWSDPEIGPPGW